jgi:hypothetical protein
MNERKHLVTDRKGKCVLRDAELICCKYIARKATVIAVTCFLFVDCTASFAFQIPKSPCGSVPLSVCHQPPRCTGDGWVPGALLPQGSGCSTSLGQPGECDKGGSCQAVPKGPSGSVSPAYYLITVLYAPPGLKSKATYTNSSTVGASTSVANMFGSGITAGITGDVIATANYQVTAETSQSFQVTKTVGSNLDISAQTDSIQHGQDTFYIWFNPVINYSQQQSPGLPVNMSLASAPSASNVVPFNLNELTGQETMASWKLPYVKNISKAEYAQIASADPWVSPGYQPDPNRYVKVTSLQLDGPDNPGDAIPGQGVNVTDSDVNCTTNSVSWSLGANFGTSAGIDFFGASEKVTVVESVTWKDTSSVGNCNGATQGATVDLATPTVGFHDVIDVYEDSIFHGFAYVSETQGAGLPASDANISGAIKDAGGVPLANQLVVVKFADGSTRELFSNAQGNYRIFKVPPGATRITSGDSVSLVTFVSGRPIVKQLTVGSSILSPKPLPVKP